ncbi:hypothetical protein [Halomonas sp. JS92-SW72]|uniref:hypothetical protein n=1 Tax=Halomonas sp. JS92-SW72 TaxID=2306583 RepID=UPI001968E8A1|nr:hypothetical protein [Halomonas sp. JS92-SW72]
MGDNSKLSAQEDTLRGHYLTITLSARRLYLYQATRKTAPRRHEKLTLPVGRDAAGMLLYLQVLSSPWQKARLLSIGQAVEAKLSTGLGILG